MQQMRANPSVTQSEVCLSVAGGWSMTSGHTPFPVDQAAGGASTADDSKPHLIQ